nr:Retrovirus-related Pol polyprotein from transposon TNT 1-94 [Ipomoea batatas]
MREMMMGVGFVAELAERERVRYGSEINESKAYRLYNPITKKIVISRDVIFNEDCFWPWNSNVVQQVPVPLVDETEDDVPTVAHDNQQNETSFELPSESIIEPRPQRDRRRPAWMSDYEVTGIDSEDAFTHFALFSDCDPTTYLDVADLCQTARSGFAYERRSSRAEEGKRYEFSGVVSTRTSGAARAHSGGDWG